MIFDIIVLAVLLISAVIACLRGFIREVLTIMGVVGGVLAAVALGGSLSPTMLKWITPETPPPAGEEPEKIFGVVPPELMADILAYGAIFIVVVLVLSVVSHFLSGWARAIGLGAVDRSFGVLFGLARGAVMLALLYLPVYLIFDKESRDTWFEGSKTHHYVEASAQWMEQFIPENAAADLRKKADQATDKSAEQMIEGARSRLENLEGLRPEEEAAPVEETPAGEGYEREERRDMNELIMDSVNE